MSRERAHQILDDAKRGLPIPESLISQALRATGDLDHQAFKTDEDEMH